MKKTLFLTLTAFALVLSTQASKADETGSCGPNCTYTLTPQVDENGNPVMVTETYQAYNPQTRRYETNTREVQAQTLNISGTGSIQDASWYTSDSSRASITSVNIGEGITSIGTYTYTDWRGQTYNRETAGIFANMKNLESVNLPNTLTTIGTQAFGWDPKLTSITIPDGVTTIGSGAFNSSGLTEVTLPNSLTSIASYVFKDTNLTNIDIPDSVTSIGYGAFWNSGLTNVSLPDSLTSIGEQAFAYTSLTDVTIPESVVSIGRAAFATGTLQNMVIDGDYVALSSDPADNWEAGYYGVNLGDPTANILSVDYSGASNLQNLYCSVEMAEECQKLLNSAAALLKTSPASLITFEKSGDYYMVGHDRYSSIENMRNGIKSNKRIYTVEEAAKVSKETGNTFRIRYK